MIPFLLANWRLFAIGFAALAVFYAGYHTKAILVEAGQAKVQAQIIADYKKSTDHMQAISKAYEDGKAHAATSVRATHKTLEADRAKNPVINCAINDFELRALNQ